MCLYSLSGQRQTESKVKGLVFEPANFVPKDDEVVLRLIDCYLPSVIKLRRYFRVTYVKSINLCKGHAVPMSCVFRVRPAITLQAFSLHTLTTSSRGYDVVHVR